MNPQQPWIDQDFHHRVAHCDATVRVSSTTQVTRTAYRTGTVIYVAVCPACHRRLKVGDHHGGNVRLVNVVAAMVRPHLKADDSVSMPPPAPRKLAPLSQRHCSVKERRRAAIRKFAKKYKRPVCFRGGVLYFVADNGIFLGPVPRAPKIPLPGKVAHGEGGPQAWHGSCYFLSEQEQQQAKRNPAYIDHDSHPLPAPRIEYFSKTAGKHRRW